MGFGRLIITIVLFIILSPGVLLNLPPAGNTFWDLGNFMKSEGGLNLDDMISTGQTNIWSVIAHAVLFGLVMMIVNTVTERFENTQQKDDTVMDTIQGWWNKATEAVGITA